MAILGIGYAQDLLPPRDETARLSTTKENAINLPFFSKTRKTWRLRTVPGRPENPWVRVNPAQPDESGHNGATAR